MPGIKSKLQRFSQWFNTRTNAEIFGFVGLWGLADAIGDFFRRKTDKNFNEKYGLKSNNTSNNFRQFRSDFFKYSATPFFVVFVLAGVSLVIDSFTGKRREDRRNEIRELEAQRNIFLASKAKEPDSQTQMNYRQDWADKEKGEKKSEPTRDFQK